MAYGILLDGQLFYAKEYYVCEDGVVISNFNQNEKLMKEYGYKVVINEVPEYDIDEEVAYITEFIEEGNKIIVKYEIIERPKTREELRQQDQFKCIQLYADILTDEQALLVPLVFDEWEVGKGYTMGKRVLYQDVLYKVITSHTSQETWTPDVSSGLFAKVINKTLDGSIPEWVQPDSVNAYMIGDKVLFEGVVYESLVDNNVWSPSANPSGWQSVEEKVEEPETPVEPEEPEVETVPEWVQPDATNPYKKGDKVMFEGKVYESTIDGNVWSPSTYPAGWQLIG